MTGPWARTGGVEAASRKCRYKAYRNLRGATAALPPRRGLILARPTQPVPRPRRRRRRRLGEAGHVGGFREVVTAGVPPVARAQLKQGAWTVRVRFPCADHHDAEPEP